MAVQSQIDYRYTVLESKRNLKTQPKQSVEWRNSSENFLKTGCVGNRTLDGATIESALHVEEEWFGSED